MEIGNSILPNILMNIHEDVWRESQAVVSVNVVFQTLSLQVRMPDMLEFEFER
jgi:hypothetical protein